jgi:hypothetical protein
LLSEGCEVEPVEAFHRREPCFPDAALDHSPFPVDQFEFGQTQQIAQMVDALGGAYSRKNVGSLIKRLEVMGEQKLRRVAHDEAPARRSR